MWMSRAQYQDLTGKLNEIQKGQIKFVDELTERNATAKARKFELQRTEARVAAGKFALVIVLIGVTFGLMFKSLPQLVRLRQLPFEVSVALLVDGHDAITGARTPKGCFSASTMQRH